MTVALIVKAGAASVFIALVDPAWAVPIQTFLLIVLTVITARVHKGVKRAEENTTEAKANATHAASAAAAAAAVARDSNRIVKDIGGALRTTAPPAEEDHTS